MDPVTEGLSSQIIDFGSWVQGAWNSFVNWVVGGIQSFTSWVVGIVNSFTSWLFSSIKSFLIDPIYNAINSVLSRFIERIDRLIFIMVVVPIEIKLIKDFARKPSLKGLFGLIATPIAGYIGSRILAEFLRYFSSKYQGIQQLQPPQLLAPPPVVSLEQFRKQISDNLTITDDVILTNVSSIINVNIQDIISIIDNIVSSFAFHVLIRNVENIQLTDNVVVSRINPLNVNISDVINVGDSCYRYFINNVLINNVENINVSDNIVVNRMSPQNVNVSDVMSITDVCNVQLVLTNYIQLSMSDYIDYSDEVSISFEPITIDVIVSNEYSLFK